MSNITGISFDSAASTSEAAQSQALEQASSSQATRHSRSSAYTDAYTVNISSAGRALGEASEVGGADPDHDGH